MTSEFPSVKAKEKIEIAVATDTVLYLPFYVAYYNNDFSNTPFSALEVVIIGTNNDFRFVSGRKLKGDGYATFAVLLGLADAAICDPSFLVYLSKCDNTELDRELRIFQEFLTPDTKQQICSKNYDEELHQCLYVKDSVLEIKQIDQFKKIIVRSTQVIGGMVSKIAFVAVGSENMISKTSLSETLGGCYLDGHLPTKAGLELIKNGFYYYHSPSTGYFVGDLYYQKYYKDNKAIKSTQVDFGEELRELCKDVYDKDNNLVPNPSYNEDCISFSCDFISVDYLLDDYKEPKSPKLAEIEDLVFNCTEKYMFSGIIGNTAPQNINKLSALLYCIDYNLFKIQSYFKKK